MNKIKREKGDKKTKVKMKLGRSYAYPRESKLSRPNNINPVESPANHPTVKKSTDLKSGSVVVKLDRRGLDRIPWAKLTKYGTCLGFDLSHNFIHLTDDLCYDLRFISYLNLSNNQLEKLPHDVSLMANLVHFDVSNNNISRLPLGIKEMKRLEWFDLRGNPFMQRWSQLNEVSERDFDPRQFALEQIGSFLEAVKAKHDILSRVRARNFREFLVICPKGPRSSRKFYGEKEQIEECPFRNVRLDHVDAFLKTLQTFDERHAQPWTYLEAWVIWSIKHALSSLPRVLCAYIMFSLLVAAFVDEKTYSEAIESFDPFLPQFFKWLLISSHTGVLHFLPRAITDHFPVPPPITIQESR